MSRDGVGSPDGRVLYVVGGRKFRIDRPEPSDPGKLWVVDPAARKILHAIAVDGSHPEFLAGNNYLKVRGTNQDFLFLDTQTNEVAMTLPRSRMVSSPQMSRDATTLFSLYSKFSDVVFMTNTSQKDRLASPPLYLRISTIGSKKQPIEIELPDSRGWAAAMCCGLILSSDEKWLYVVNRGELTTRKTSGPAQSMSSM